MATLMENKKIFGTFFLELINETKKEGSLTFYGKCGYDDDQRSVRNVFIRRYQLVNDDSDGTKESRRDLEVLQKSSGQRLHENFIRFMGSVKDSHFLFAATEFCEYSVEDLFYHADIVGNKTDSEGYKFLEDVRMKMGAKEILRQSTEGVAFLHGLGYLHRNLKPSNFRISSYENNNEKIYQIKLTDFRKTKDFKKSDENTGSTGSDGWIAPECKDLGVFLSQAVDVFILGNFFYYVLSGGIHPFDQESGNREIHITNQDCNVYKNDHDKVEEKKKELTQHYITWWTPSKSPNDDISELIQHAVDLIKQMIKFFPRERIESKEVLKHAFFNPSGNYTIYCQNKKPGLLLLFSHTKFVDKNYDVSGHEYDEKKLRKVFQEQLGFDVELYRNYFADQIEKTISEKARDEERVLKDYSCLAVCILSHGNSEAVYGSDLKEVAIHKLQYAFNSNDCPALHNKPKIFIIQACRVPQQLQLDKTKLTFREEKGKISYFYDPTKENFYKNLLNLERTFMKSTSTNLSPVNDFLCIMATIKGSPAYANKNGTSTFVETLCSKLEQNNEGNIDDILCQVQEEIAQKHYAFGIGCFLTGRRTRIQTIERITSLRKKIVLKNPLKQKKGNLLFEEKPHGNFQNLRENYAKHLCVPIRPNLYSSILEYLGLVLFLFILVIAIYIGQSYTK